MPREGDYMVSFELIDFDGKVYTYKYYPEMDETAPGIISIDKYGNREIIEVKKNDVKNLYLGHAFEAIEPGQERGSAFWW